MNTTFNNTNIEAQINQTETDALSLSEFNRMHAGTILAATEAKRAYHSRLMTDKVFEAGSLVLFVTTVTAGAWGLLTMIAH